MAEATSSTDLAGFPELEQAIGEALGTCLEGTPDEVRRSGNRLYRAYHSPEFNQFREAYGRVLSFVDDDSYETHFIDMSQARDKVMATLAQDPTPPSLMLELGELKNYLWLVKDDVERMDEASTSQD